MTPLTPELLQAYLDTDYRVRLRRGGHASIRIGQPLPMALQALAGGAHWGLLTAWNPASQPRSRASNRRAQRCLRQRLAQGNASRCDPAAGVGADGWREPSLWIVGMAADQLHALAAAFGQWAWVGPDAAGHAALQYPAGLPGQTAACVGSPP